MNAFEWFLSTVMFGAVIFGVAYVVVRLCEAYLIRRFNQRIKAQGLPPEIEALALQGRFEEAYALQARRREEGWKELQILALNNAFLPWRRGQEIPRA